MRWDNSSKLSIPQTKIHGGDSNLLRLVDLRKTLIDKIVLNNQATTQIQRPDARNDAKKVK
jgi:hypothetical protein